MTESDKIIDGLIAAIRRPSPEAVTRELALREQFPTNPGGDEAIKKGCSCPYNDGGRGFRCLDGERGFDIEPTCPVHGEDFDYIKEFPPGGAAAVKMGCTCPVLDNAHGAGILNPRPGQEPRFYTYDNCPLHGKEEQ